MKKIAIATDRQSPVGSVFPFWQNYVNEGYVNAITKAGRRPLLIPFCNPTETDEILEDFDGLVLTGGNDVSPILYGEENIASVHCDEPLDRFHMGLITSARKMNIPILGICRGFQLLNISFGGTLIQDIPSERPSSVNHKQVDKSMGGAHPVDIVLGSNLYTALKEKSVWVNSLHHQGVKDLGFGLKPSSYAPDGLIESFEGTNVLGVQWHPEAMFDKMQPLFTYFINEMNRPASHLL